MIIGTYVFPPHVLSLTALFPDTASILTRKIPVFFTSYVFPPHVLSLTALFPDTASILTRKIPVFFTSSGGKK